MKFIDKLIEASPEAFIMLLCALIIASSGLATGAYVVGRVHQSLKDRRQRRIANDLLRAIQYPRS